MRQLFAVTILILFPILGFADETQGPNPHVDEARQLILRCEQSLEAQDVSDSELDAALASGKRLEAFFAEASKVFVERDYLYSSIQKALIGRQPFLLIGPPGNAKTQVAKYILSNITDEKGKPSFFTDQMTFETTVSDTHGPLDFKELQLTGRQNRFYDEGILGHYFALLDEQFDMRPNAYRNILSVLAENKHRGYDGKTWVVAGASNKSLPEVYARFDLYDDQARALIDRYAFVIYVGAEVIGAHNNVHIIKGGGRNPPKPPPLSIEDLRNLNRLMDKVEIPDHVAYLLTRIDFEFKPITEAKEAQSLANYLEMTQKGQKPPVPPWKATKYASPRTSGRSGVILKASIILDWVKKGGNRALTASLDDLGELYSFYSMNGPSDEEVTYLLSRTMKEMDKSQLSTIQIERQLYHQLFEENKNRFNNAVAQLTPVQDLMAQARNIGSMNEEQRLDFEDVVRLQFLRAYAAHKILDTAKRSDLTPELIAQDSVLEMMYDILSLVNPDKDKLADRIGGWLQDMQADPQKAMQPAVNPIKAAREAKEREATEKAEAERKAKLTEERKKAETEAAKKAKQTKKNASTGQGENYVAKTLFGDFPDDFTAANLEEIPDGEEIPAAFDRSTQWQASPDGTHWFHHEHGQIYRINKDRVLGREYHGEAELAVLNDEVLYAVPHRELRVASFDKNGDLDVPAVGSPNPQLQDGQVYVHFVDEKAQAFKVANLNTRKLTTFKGKVTPVESNLSITTVSKPNVATLGEIDARFSWQGSNGVLYTIDNDLRVVRQLTNNATITDIHFDNPPPTNMKGQFLGRVDDTIYVVYQNGHRSWIYTLNAVTKKSSYVETTDAGIEFPTAAYVVPAVTEDQNFAFLHYVEGTGLVLQNVLGGRFQAKKVILTEDELEEKFAGELQQVISVFVDFDGNIILGTKWAWNRNEAIHFFKIPSKTISAKMSAGFQNSSSNSNPNKQNASASVVSNFVESLSGEEAFTFDKSDLVAVRKDTGIAVEAKPGTWQTSADGMAFAWRHEGTLVHISADRAFEMNGFNVAGVYSFLKDAALLKHNNSFSVVGNLSTPSAGIVNNPNGTAVAHMDRSYIFFADESSGDLVVADLHAKNLLYHGPHGWYKTEKLDGVDVHSTKYSDIQGDSLVNGRHSWKGSDGNLYTLGYGFQSVHRLIGNTIEDVELQSRLPANSGAQFLGRRGDSVFVGYSGRDHVSYVYEINPVAGSMDFVAVSDVKFPGAIALAPIGHQSVKDGLYLLAYQKGQGLKLIFSDPNTDEGRLILSEAELINSSPGDLFWDVQNIFVDAQGNIILASLRAQSASALPSAPFAKGTQGPGVYLDIKKIQATTFKDKVMQDQKWQAHQGMPAAQTSAKPASQAATANHPNGTHIFKAKHLRALPVTNGELNAQLSEKDMWQTSPDGFTFTQHSNGQLQTVSAGGVSGMRSFGNEMDYAVLNGMTLWGNSVSKLALYSGVHGQLKQNLPSQEAPLVPGTDRLLLFAAQTSNSFYLANLDQGKLYTYSARPNGDFKMNNLTERYEGVRSPLAHGNNPDTYFTFDGSTGHVYSLHITHGVLRALSGGEIWDVPLTGGPLPKTANAQFLGRRGDRLYVGYTISGRNTWVYEIDVKSSRVESWQIKDPRVTFPSAAAIAPMPFANSELNLLVHLKGGVNLIHLDKHGSMSSHEIIADQEFNVLNPVPSYRFSKLVGLFVDTTGNTVMLAQYEFGQSVKIVPVKLDDSTYSQLDPRAVVKK